MNTLGNVYIMQNRLAEAKTVHKEVLAFRRKNVGNTHQHTIASMLNLSKAYFDGKEYSKAESLLQEIFVVESMVLMLSD